MSETAVRHTTPQECKEAFLEQFEEATENGKWIAIVATYEDGNLKVQRTTCEFPTNEFDHFTALLDRDLKKERKAGLLDDSPLELAPHLQRILNERNKLPSNPTASKNGENGSN